MVDFGTPYAMDNTVIPGAGLRRQLQQSAGPGSGVLRVGDFRITQMDVPGQGVKIAAGDDLVQCRAPGRDRETYGVPLYTDQVYMGDGGDGIPGTGSSAGRRDMIIHEILDPELPRHFTPREAWPEGQFSKLSVVSGVPAGAKTVADVPALNNVTCYELAAINWPKSTGTITNAIIEDLRVVQSPQEKTLMRTLGITGDTREVLTASTAYPAGGMTWPVAAEQAWRALDIPEWATHAQVRMEWAGVYCPNGAEIYCEAWVQIGATVNPNHLVAPFTAWQTNGGSGSNRTGVVSASEVAIPAALRGTAQVFYPRARQTGSGAARPVLDRGSAMVLQVVFSQRAV